MAKSAKERMREYRLRMKENAEKYEKHKAADRERYKDKKNRGVVRSVKNMTQREHRKIRRQWKQSSQVYREKQRVKNNILTPPVSPEPHVQIQDPSVQAARRDQIQDPPVQAARRESMLQSHRRRKSKEKSACYRTNKKLKLKLKFQTRLTEKYKKRFYRLQGNKVMRNKGKKFDKRSYTLYKTLVRNIRKWYERSNNRLEKRKLSSIIAGKRTLKKYGLGAYARSVLGFSRRHIAQKSKPLRKVGFHVEMRTKVRQFLERDDNSRMTADKQATITRSKVKMQKRLLNADLRSLHRKYESEGNKMSYSTFCKFRPYWIVQPTEKDRDTCLCKVHENMTYKIDTCYKEDMVRSKEISVLMNEIVCDQQQKECMYRECKECKEKKLKMQNVDGKQVIWNNWQNQRVEKESDGKPKIVNRTVKDTVQGTRETLQDELNKELARACRHIFNIRHQYKTLKFLQMNLQHEEIIMHIDFSENYNTRYGKEIQSVHFGASKQQISLHTGVAYIGGDKVPFCTVSDCIKHGPAAIWAHLDPVICYLKSIRNFTSIHFVSDGPTTQYRNKLNFYLWCTKVFSYGFSRSSWNFLEAAHGKGAADGVGAAVKRAADYQVNVKGNDITCGQELINLVQQSCSVKMFHVKESAIVNLEKQPYPSLQPITDTMKIHQMITDSRCRVSHRVVSCFCQHPLPCDCYSPAIVLFPDVHETHTNLSVPTPITDPVAATPDAQPVSISPDTAPVSTTCSSSQASPGTSTPEPSQSFPATQQNDSLKRIDVLRDDLIGQHCVVEYEGLPYPGIILDVDEDSVEVSAMARIGVNSFFWPLIEDRMYYQKEDVITLLDKEPPLVTKRHRKLDEKLWVLICEQLGLDEHGRKYH